MRAQAQKEVVRTTAAMERVEHELMLERESNKLRPTVEMMNEARAQAREEPVAAHALCSELPFQGVFCAIDMSCFLS